MRLINDGPDIPDRLIQAHEDGDVVFFCGAGVSYPAGLPLFGELVKRIYQQIGETMTPAETQAFNNSQFDTTIQLLERRVESKLVRDAIAVILTVTGPRRTAVATHRALLRLATDSLDRTRLVTTNVDRLFLRADRKKRAYVAPHLPIAKRSAWNGVAYLHGLLPKVGDDDPFNRLILSSGDFGLAYLVERWASRFVSELFRSFIVCFVGYSVDDPVLRYMVDALWADRRVGEAEVPVFAFASHTQGGELEAKESWAAKGIVPIQYVDTNRHERLHKTLQRWSRVYAGGLNGKQAIVARDARSVPSRIQGDGQVGRVLWGLSDTTGMSAKVFAELPAPIEWLSELRQRDFEWGDLIRFGVPHKPAPKEPVKFSFVARPTLPLTGVYQKLVYRDQARDTYPALDGPMFHLAVWIAENYLDKAEVLNWIAQEGPALHPTFRSLILRKLREGGLPAFLIPFWQVVSSGRTRGSVREWLPDWLALLKQYGATLSLRTELRLLLQPLAHFSPSRRALFTVDRASAHQGPPSRLPEIVHSEVVLRGGDHADIWIREAAKLPAWAELQDSMISEFGDLLIEAFDLLYELGEITRDSDFSYVARPAIGTSRQSPGGPAWEVLVDLSRDSMTSVYKTDPAKARSEIGRWRKHPYPIFRRLVYYIAATTDILTVRESVQLLREDSGWWMFSAETKNEALRLIERLAIRARGVDSRAVGKLIVGGPPRSRFRPDIEPSYLKRVLAGEIILRLNAFKAAGARLAPVAAQKLQKLLRDYPMFAESRPAPVRGVAWVGGGSVNDFRQVAALTRDRATLVSELKNRPSDQFFHEDDWRDICEKDLPLAIGVLSDLAAGDVWATEVWSDALHVWAQDGNVAQAWVLVTPLLQRMPREPFGKILHGVGYLLRSAGKTVSLTDSLFFILLGRVVEAQSSSVWEVTDDVVGKAINDPVGHVIEGAFDLWYRTKPSLGAGLTSVLLRDIFTRIADAPPSGLLSGLVIIASNLNSLFLVDNGWTREHLLPVFDWKAGEDRAGAAWEGYLWNPRLARELFVALKPSFLSTAAHYDQLTKHAEQYVGLLIWTALEYPDLLGIAELRGALHFVPAKGLASGVQVLATALEGAGDRASELWQTRVKPILIGAWPKSVNRKSPEQSTWFGQLCAAAGTGYPDAIATILPLASETRNNVIAFQTIMQKNLAKEFPADTLKLLRRLVDTAETFVTEDLRKLLNDLGTAQPKLKKLAAYKRLADFAAAHTL
jgi:SIR2-like domain